VLAAGDELVLLGPTAALEAMKESATAPGSAGAGT
jgi:hypothetical protein